VANPNCSTAGLVLALAPLHRAFGIERLFVATMQAVSGAGYPGVPSLDILGNVIPFVSGEEEKLERESAKILGSVKDSAVEAAGFALSAHTNRVPVVDGHTEVVSVGFRRRVSVEEALEAYRSFAAPERVARLPSTPGNPVEVDLRPDRPQPRLDIERGNGMTVTVGRLRPCPVLDLRLVLLSHNTVRGAAGAAVQNAELAVVEGWVAK
jgi:aspartate-semialdehyde dehydrogenase